LGDALGGELRSEVVVGPLFRGVGALRGDAGQDGQEKDKDPFHIVLKMIY
jgi:hypothetical protein